MNSTEDKYSLKNIIDRMPQSSKKMDYETKLKIAGIIQSIYNKKSSET